MTSSTSRKPGLALAVTPKQTDFLAGVEFTRGFVGGRGSGKTWVGAADILTKAKDGDAFMAVSPSYVVMTDTTWPTFKELAQAMGVWIKGVKSPTHKAWFRTQDGGTADIIFRSGDNPDSLRGPSKMGLWLDEASIMSEDVLKIGSACLRYKGRLGRLTVTMTPRGRTHWTFGLFFRKVGPIDHILQGAHGEGAALADAWDGVRFRGRPELEVYHGIVYRRAPRTRLVQSHSRENPFLNDQFVQSVGQQYSEMLKAQELGGQFVDIEGLLFAREDFKIVNDLAPKTCMRVRYWDRAIDETGTGSETACVLLARTADDDYVVEDMKHGHWGAKERDDLILETARRDALAYDNEVLIYVEQEGGSAGVEVSRDIVRKLAGYPVYADKVSGRRVRKSSGVILPGQAKIVRSQPVAAAVEAGLVSIVRGEWNADFLDQLAAFPESAKNDIVDALSGAYWHLSKRTGAYAPPTKTVEETGAELGRFGQLVGSLKANPGKRTSSLSAWRTK